MSLPHLFNHKLTANSSFYSIAKERLVKPNLTHVSENIKEPSKSPTNSAKVCKNQPDREPEEKKTLKRYTGSRDYSNPQSYEFE